jgi:hypothetical protein
MVQPKYSPEEALEKMKLMMKYDSSRTLNENKQTISEQTAGNPVDPVTLAAGGAGAVLGGMYAGAAAGTAAFPVVGTVIGAVVGLGLGALSGWWANKDYGRDGFAQVISVCKAAGASKLVPKMSKSEIRTLAYQIEDAKGQWNDDEDAIASALQKVESVADLCALDKRITGGLLEFLDNLTDSPDEWKMFTRPLAGMIEDTEVALTPEEQEKVKKDGGKTGGGGGTKTGYKPCTGTYSFGCKSDVIAKVQGCLGGLVSDGKFGPKTKAALADKGFSTFTDAEVDKICNKPTTTPTVNSDEEDVDASDPNQL